MKTATKTTTTEQPLKAPEIAERLRIDVQTVYRLRKKGKLPSHRIGRSLRFYWSEIQAALNTQGAINDHSN